MKFHFLYLFILIFILSCQKKDSNYYETIAINDVKIARAYSNEWRSNHIEKFQTFNDFQKLKKIEPTAEKKIIYLQPIGEFNSLQEKQIEYTRQYLKIYFQLEAKILPTISNEIFPKTVRRISKDGQEQILAGYVLDSVLITRKPKDAVVLMGITEGDLFPKPQWNYVFGLASYQKGVGVTSLYRFADGNLSESNFNQSLERLIKISSHEIGHMFGISHCLNANCVMNGTNSLTETDIHFARACSLCQQKLNSSLKYNDKKRLLELKKFFEENSFNAELSRTEKDLNLVQ